MIPASSVEGTVMQKNFAKRAKCNVSLHKHVCNPPATYELRPLKEPGVSKQLGVLESILGTQRQTHTQVNL